MEFHILGAATRKVRAPNERLCRGTESKCLSDERMDTETALQLLLDRIYSISDEGRPILLVSLDFSAALDMVDYTTLLKRLSCSFGVSGVVHSWIESYLCGRTQSVRMGSRSSAVTPCTVGLPQGSVLGPLLCLHFSTAHHCSIPSGPSTAVHRRYATLCRSVTPKL